LRPKTPKPNPAFRLSAWPWIAGEIGNFADAIGRIAHETGNFGNVVVTITCESGNFADVIDDTAGEISNFTDVIDDTAGEISNFTDVTGRTAGEIGNFKIVIANLARKMKKGLETSFAPRYNTYEGIRLSAITFKMEAQWLKIRTTVSNRKC